MTHTELLESVRRMEVRAERLVNALAGERARPGHGQKHPFCVLGGWNWPKMLGEKTFSNGGDRRKIGGSHREIGGNGRQNGGSTRRIGGGRRENGGSLPEIGGSRQNDGGNGREIGGQASDIGGKAGK